MLAINFLPPHSCASQRARCCWRGRPGTGGHGQLFHAKTQATIVKNIDFNYTATINMKVNEYLSALLEIQLLYDDNALADLQTRQVFGLVVALPF